MPRSDEDLPGYWAVLFMRAMVKHPAGYAACSPLLLVEEIHADGAIAFTKKNRTLGIRNVMVFEAVPPWLTCSRAYASPVRLPEPSQGSLPAWTGSPLAGRVSHPLDDESKFHGVIAIPPIPIDQQSLVALFCLCALMGLVGLGVLGKRRARISRVERGGRGSKRSSNGKN